ncbi:TPA: H-NS histone family protein [Klebsiella pneumoniae]|nr:H-NS histone family protein [Klebsiella pneumoniae]
MSRKDEPRSSASKESENSVPKRRKIEFVPLHSEKSPKGEPKYRDPANPFNTWSGKGKRPEWLRKYIEEGRVLSEFEIGV